MMRIVSFFLFMAGLFSAFPAVAGSGNIAVVEFFTAQGCFDAPVAEQIFSTLAEEAPEGVIFLSCHVTSFDNEEWSDPLGREFCEERQDIYEDNYDIFENGTIPQVVINGRFKNKGDDDAMMRAGIAMAQGLDEIEPVQMSFRDDGGVLDVTLSKMRGGAGADIWLLAYDRRHVTPVTAGSNAGQVLKHINALVHAERLERWDGEYRNISVALDDMAAEGYVILAQRKSKSGDEGIIAAGKIER